MEEIVIKEKIMMNSKRRSNTSSLAIIKRSLITVSFEWTKEV